MYVGRSAHHIFDQIASVLSAYCDRAVALPRRAVGRRLEFSFSYLVPPSILCHSTRPPVVFQYGLSIRRGAVSGLSDLLIPVLDWLFDGLFQTSPYEAEEFRADRWWRAAGRF